MNCTLCRYSSIDLGKSPQAGKLLCRLNPPSPAAIAIPTPGGVTVQVLTIWATVTPDDWCQQFEQAISFGDTKMSRESIK
jgi:hypothetical protein